MHSSDFHSDVAYARQNLSLHIVADGDVDGVALVHLVDIDGKVVLVIADALALGSTILVDELAVYRVYLRFASHLLGVVIDVLLYDECQTHEGIIACDAKSQAFAIVTGFPERWNLKRQGVVFLPTCYRRMGILVVYGLLIARWESN